MFKSDHTAFAVRDLERSRAFYVHLGGRVVSKPSANFVEVMLGDMRLHMVQATADDGGDPAGVRPGIDHVCLAVEKVADLEAVLERINAYPEIRERAHYELGDSPMLGTGFVEHAEERPPLKTLYFRDPDGIMLEIRAYA
jgi:catechol 2,3-dioxygenase-like lactoylglutathione lyase family enzyme